MDERKETLSVIIYLMNKFSVNESTLIFGEILGEHIFNKWENECNRHAEWFICELDEGNLNLLVNRACEIYCGRERRE